MNKFILVLAIFAFIAPTVLCADAKTVIGDIIKALNGTIKFPVKNTTNTTIPTTPTTPTTPVVNNTTPETPTTPTTPVVNNTTPTTPETPTTPTTPVKYAKNDVNMKTFPEDCLRVHNQERMAVGLNNLTWSDSLAASAQTWAENMAKKGLKHSGKSGENIASSSYSTKTFSRLIGMWTKEKGWYIPGCKYGKCSSNGKEVGHYTQMVWHSTTQVGCGFAPGYNRGYNYLCCQYYKAGNVVGQSVYPYPIPTN